MQLIFYTLLNKGENKYEADINEYLYNYMAKNLYYISSAKDFYAGIEYKKVQPTDSTPQRRWINLVPSNFDTEKDDMAVALIRKPTS